MTAHQLLQRVDAFLRSVSDDDIVAIVHDTDPDGIFSAVILSRCLKRLRGRGVDIHLPLNKEKYGITEDMIARFKQKGVTKLIAADFSLEQNLDRLKELEKLFPILIVDHHKLYNDYSSDRVILYKPQKFTDIEPSQYCTAKLAFDAAMRVCDVSDLDWMAASACIADIATAPWKDWLSSVFIKYNLEQNDDLFTTKLGDIASIVSSTELYDVALVPSCFAFFSSAKTIEDVFQSEFIQYKHTIDAELEKHRKRFETHAKHRGELYIYELDSPYRVQSALSTILGIDYPHRTIIIINVGLPMISVSARRGDKQVAVNELLEQAVEGFDHANAGGHIPAAGAGFPKHYLEKFKENLWKTAPLA